MRWLIFGLVVVLFFLPSPPALALEGITPGDRIGPWRLGTSVATLSRLIGPTCSPESGYVEADLVSAITEVCAPALCIFYRASRGALYLQTSQAGRLSTTPQGITVGSPAGAVVAAYGPPTLTTRRGDDFAGIARLIYDGIGLALRVNPMTDTVVAIAVFRPGTARSIWR